MASLTAKTCSAGAAVHQQARTTQRVVSLRPASVKTAARSVATSAVATPTKEQWKLGVHAPTEKVNHAGLPQLISKEQVVSLEAMLDQGSSIAALRRFNDNLRALPADSWESALRPVFAEMTYNLESFNPAFASCLLMVQRTLGHSDYVRRDMALKNLIQPLAGEYGMNNNQPQLKTHRELFSEFYTSLFHSPLEELVAGSARPAAAELLWSQMNRDIMGGGGAVQAPMEQASYALGYNLAIEYLADYEKTWMLDSFRDMSDRYMAAQGRKINWVFLEVHAEGEAEHAAIGHAAVLNFVPAEHVPIMQQAMKDHDRDFAVFYNRMADMLAQ
eukprot:CAMPEP_0119108852 /NCGR_PEP_ID=MMETSP1180-20130426/15773_1 /TAXON_ID=3052 ORGANISM="Chlamydomonas cf sp, Strain CCMP681" /NCGR_SAMPLE_ID=MMETSP1180 /ASSEMBLY_ACC=CAM_ASM_000741 /LENGTH=330 /DNA_ID=CAMNT_0007094519 /DNA_START=13 /DNA_END=1005 /DNA_ORIENTATION=+